MFFSSSIISTKVLRRFQLQFPSDSSLEELPRFLISPSYLKKICRFALLNKDFDIDHAKYPPEDIADPCGYMAKFFPQDQFISIETIDPSSRGKRFRRIVQEISIDLVNVRDPNFYHRFHHNLEKNQWMDVEDPRFVNWMV
jgi:hypothetical protein